MPPLTTSIHNTHNINGQQEIFEGRPPGASTTAKRTFSFQQQHIIWRTRDLKKPRGRNNNRFQKKTSCWQRCIWRQGSAPSPGFFEGCLWRPQEPAPSTSSTTTTNNKDSFQAARHLMCNSNNTLFSSNECKSTLSGGGTRKHAEAGTPPVRNKDCSKLKQRTARNKKKKSEENATSQRTILQNERKISKISRKTHGKPKKTKQNKEKKTKIEKKHPALFWMTTLRQHNIYVFCFLDKILHNVNYFRKLYAIFPPRMTNKCTCCKYFGIRRGHRETQNQEILE